ncbi:MAG: hypothetical protein K0Q47_17 [Sedimentibacter sp.]|jgi:hypothetical protein|nr:hypothetical protein [Sedimentibacter sp.]
MRLKFKNFNSPEELCAFVNDDESSINIFGICQDEFGKYVLFFGSNSTERINNIEAEPRLDVEEFWASRYERRNNNGGENQ